VRSAGTLATELSEHSFVEAARIGANGSVEFCVARHADVGDDVSNRQCFALQPDGTSVTDMPEWHVDAPEVGWSDSGITLTRADGVHEVPFTFPSDGDDEAGELSAVLSPRGDVVAAILPGPHATGTVTVTVLNVATGATIFTVSPPRALTQNFALLGGLLVNTYAYDMNDGGTFRVEFFTPTGTRQRIGRCPATPDLPCAWELSPTRAAILTYRGVVIFDRPRARREATGFNPRGGAVRWVLEDATRNRLYAIRDRPLGSVDVFDRALHRVVRTVAPRGP
jgi:hypothetical protein